jgi:pimeloyl-ACP methyl ester carboxylesterase
VVVPDLYGFGFSPRQAAADEGPAAVLRHLEALLEAVLQTTGSQRVGLIGASMGARWPWSWPDAAQRRSAACCCWRPPG